MSKMSANSSDHRPRLVNGSGTSESTGSNDELMRKFSKNMRRLLNSNTPKTDQPSGTTPQATKSVTFNTETIETSFGGTQSPGTIAERSIVETVSGECQPHDRMFTKSSVNPSIRKPLIPAVERLANSTQNSEGRKGSSQHHGVAPGERPVSSKRVDNQEETSESSTPAKCSKEGAVETPRQYASVKSTLLDTAMAENLTPLKPPRPGVGKITGQGTPQLAKGSTPQQFTGAPQQTLHNTSSTFRTPSPFHASSIRSRRHTAESLSGTEAATPDCFTSVAFETPASGARGRAGGGGVGRGRWSSGDVNGWVAAGEGGVEEGVEEDSVTMTVAVRVRPFTHREEEEGEQCAVSMLDNETLVTGGAGGGGEPQRFTYDYSFWSFDSKSGDFATQEEVYSRLARPMLRKAFDGYNTCLFAYGQTGSGKSYSIMGHDSSDDHVGIIPRFCAELFEQAEAVTQTDTSTSLNLEISYFEIYNEKIHDLLCPSTKNKTGNKKATLKVREHPVLGPYVEGLSSYVVKTFEDVKSWLSVGNKHRATAATGMNDKSSRSHSVFTTVLTQTKTDLIEGETHEHSITSKINIVDLAGSERQSLAKTSGDRLREGASINRSLHTLGKVICVLAEQSSKKKKLHVPYRDSVLTWLLKESVGGNSKTAMLATISPALRHVEETLSTLRYARQARSIVNKVRVNEDPKARLIRELKAEIERMRLAMGVEGGEPLASWAEVTQLRQQLAQRELEMREMSRSWRERLERSEEKKQEEARMLERSGVAFKVDSSLPHLVNLNEDPQLSEVLLYVLREGSTSVGRQAEGSRADIQLAGPLIADQHCVLDYTDGTIRVTPHGDAAVYVNGDLLTAQTQINHGDRVILGGDHYFRLNYPGGVGAGDKRASGAQSRDFEFARQELTRVQNQRLEEELALRLETELRAQQCRAESELEQVRSEASEQLEGQRREYEARLRDLEQNLDEQRLRMQASDVNQQAASDALRRLEHEKQVLEQEVLLNRKRMELEAKASSQLVAKSKASHSLLLEQLQLEKEKLDSEVQKYESKKRQRQREEQAKQRARTEGKNGTSGAVASGPRSNLYRNFMLIREANRISQLLNKDTVFSAEERVVVEGGEPQTVVKVTNRKLKVSTYWTLAKFEDKLVRMKEIYEGEEEEGADNEATFLDPGDAWEKEDRLAHSPRLSPQILTSLRRQTDRQSPLTNRSPRDSPIFALTDSRESEEIPGSQQMMTQQLFALYRDVITATAQADSTRDNKESPSPADRVLYQCERLKRAVTCVLRAYNGDSLATDTTALATDNTALATEGSILATNGSSETKSGRASLYSNTELPLALINTQTALSSLEIVTSLWRCQAPEGSSALVEELGETAVSVVRKLASHAGLFLQGCENDIDSVVQESSSQLFSQLFYLGRVTGELATAAQTPLTALRPANSAEERDLLSAEVCSHCVRGCERFLDRTLQGGASTLEDCEARVGNCADLPALQEGADSVLTLVKQVEMTVAAGKILLEKLQCAQVELDTTLSVRDSLQPRHLLPSSSSSCLLSPSSSCLISPSSSSSALFHTKWQRCQSLLSHVTNMADGVTLLTQATENLAAKGATGADVLSLRRLYRCSDMIQKAYSQIHSTVNASHGVTDTSPCVSDSSHSSTISSPRPSPSVKHHKSCLKYNSHENNSSIDQRSKVSGQSSVKRGDSGHDQFECRCTSHVSNGITWWNEAQSEQVSVAGQELEFAVNTLIVLLRRQLEEAQQQQLKSPSAGSGGTGTTASSRSRVLGQSRTGSQVPGSPRSDQSRREVKGRPQEVTTGQVKRALANWGQS